MEQKFMNKKELKTAVDAFVSKATLADQKWLYCYFTELDEWPLITDEVKIDNEEINHYVHNFVDDSNSISSGRKEEDVKRCTEKYMKLMKIFYSTNILKMIQLKQL